MPQSPGPDPRLCLGPLPIARAAAALFQTGIRNPSMNRNK